MQPTRHANIEQYRVIAKANSQLIKGHDTGAGEGGGGGVLGLIFAGYVSLVSQSPYAIIVFYSVANYTDPVLVTFGQICIFRDPK